MDTELHIASFVVLHRLEATAALDAQIAVSPALELALREGSRSILLCEAADGRSLMQQVENLRVLDGVLGVSLVHHHIEAASSLLEELDDEHPP